VFSTQDADVVGYANGRLLAGKAAALYEMSSVGVAALIWTHTNAAFVWTDFVSSPAGIYAFGELGDTSEVFVVTAIDTTGALDVPFVATPWPQGERIRAMCSYAGVMVIASTKGLRLARITGGGFLAYGPYIPGPGDVLCLEPQGEDVWFGWTFSATKNGLGRIRLKYLVDAEGMVPAYASDLRARGTVSGNVLSVATVGTRRYFAISGRGFYGETTTLETTADIDLGWFGYGIPEQKVLDSVAVWCDALPAGCSIVANVYPDDSGVASITMTMNTTGVKTQTASYSSTVTAERYRVVLTINQTGATPVIIRRVTLRAAPRPFTSEAVTLPVVLTETARQEPLENEGQDPFAEWSILHALMLGKSRCTVVVGSYSFFGRIEAIEVEKGGLGGGNGLDGWDDRMEWFEGVWDVSFVTLEPDG
jgi:hypothetical protein